MRVQPFPHPGPRARGHGAGVEEREVQAPALVEDAAAFFEEGGQGGAGEERGDGEGGVDGGEEV